MEQTTRPLDALNKSRNKRVIVDLKNGWRYVGKLQAFDIHINTVLEEAEEFESKDTVVTVMKDDNTSEQVTNTEKIMKRKLGTVFIRGDAITNISVQ